MHLLCSRIPSCGDAYVTIEILCCPFPSVCLVVWHVQVARDYQASCRRAAVHAADAAHTLTSCHQHTGGMEGLAPAEALCTCVASPSGPQTADQGSTAPATGWKGIATACCCVEKSMHATCLSAYEQAMADACLFTLQLQELI